VEAEADEDRMASRLQLDLGRPFFNARICVAFITF